MTDEIKQRQLSCHQTEEIELKLFLSAIKTETNETDEQKVAREKLLCVRFINWYMFIFIKVMIQFYF